MLMQEVFAACFILGARFGPPVMTPPFMSGLLRHYGACCCPNNNKSNTNNTHQIKRYQLVASLKGHGGSVISLIDASGFVWSEGADGSRLLWKPFVPDPSIPSKLTSLSTS